MAALIEQAPATMTDELVRLWPPKPNATTPIKCLGPMVRANSTALRILALESGADMVYSEELIARRMEVTQFRLNETLGTADWLDANGKSVALRVDPARERGRRLGVAPRVERRQFGDARP